MKLLVVLIGCITLLGCDRDGDVPTNIEGRYLGTFQRDGNQSNVTLVLNKNGFSGESDRVKFPAICNGNFSISGRTIKFEDQCVWTAEFDWSLILKDTWDFTLINDTLTLTNTLGDTYRLKRQ